MTARFHVPLRERGPNTRRQQHADVQLIDVFSPTGEQALVGLSRSRPGRGYVLTQDRDGRWLCACEQFSFRGICNHIKAASDRIAAQRKAVA